MPPRQESFRVVVRWQGMYLAEINRHTGEPRFTWAPVQALTFDCEQQARTAVGSAMKFPGDYEVINDPTYSKA